MCGKYAFPLICSSDTEQLAFSPFKNTSRKKKERKHSLCQVLSSQRRNPGDSGRRECSERWGCPLAAVVLRCQVGAEEGDRWGHTKGLLCGVSRTHPGDPAWCSPSCWASTRHGLGDEAAER